MNFTEFDAYYNIEEMLYKIEMIKAQNVIVYIEENKRFIDMNKVYKLIMVCMRNGIDRNELALLASFYKNCFYVDYYDIYEKPNNRDAYKCANLLIRMGVPVRAFVNYDGSKLTGEKDELDSYNSDLLAIFDDDPEELMEYSERFTTTFYPLNGERASYLTWSAYFGSPRVFEVLLKYIPIVNNTITTAIHIGNAQILRMIMEKNIDLHPYMKQLIKYHRNSIIDFIKMQYDLNNPEYNEIAIKNMNFHAFYSLTFNQ